MTEDLGKICRIHQIVTYTRVPGDSPLHIMYDLDKCKNECDGKDGTCNKWMNPLTSATLKYLAESYRK